MGILQMVYAHTHMYIDIVYYYDTANITGHISIFQITSGSILYDEYIIYYTSVIKLPAII